MVRRCAEGGGDRVGERVRGGFGTRAADAPRWWAATAARRARRAPGRRGMSSAPARPGPRARHGAGRARAPSHPLLREEDLPQAHVLPSLLGSAVGPHRAGLRLRRYAPRMRPARVDTGSARSTLPPGAASCTTSALCNPGPGSPGVSARRARPPRRSARSRPRPIDRTGPPAGKLRVPTAPSLALEISRAAAEGAMPAGGAARADDVLRRRVPSRRAARRRTSSTLCPSSLRNTYDGTLWLPVAKHSEHLKAYRSICFVRDIS